MRLRTGLFPDLINLFFLSLPMKEIFKQRRKDAGLFNNNINSFNSEDAAVSSAVVVYLFARIYEIYENTKKQSLLNCSTARISVDGQIHLRLTLPSKILFLSSPAESGNYGALPFRRG